LNTEPKNPFSHGKKREKKNYFRVSQRTLERMKNILQVLKAPQINHSSLEALCFNGIPDECSSLRSLAWKFLLGYLPTKTSKWEASLADHRKKPLTIY